LENPGRGNQTATSGGQTQYRKGRRERAEGGSRRSSKNLREPRRVVAKDRKAISKVAGGRNDARSSTHPSGPWVRMDRAEWMGAASTHRQQCSIQREKPVTGMEVRRKAASAIARWMGPRNPGGSETITTAALRTECREEFRRETHGKRGPQGLCVSGTREQGSLFVGRPTARSGSGQKAGESCLWVRKQS